ncbi:LPIN3 phosphatase, partial [Halcyon senegalensis]|nr:LPIN3 phosphatase [Halcyon senegalensis]
MNYLGQLAETIFIMVKELYRGLNPVILTGCTDVVVVRQPNNSFQCSPFHVCFGKLGVLRSKEKVVDVEINGELVDLHMKLGDNGEAFFVQESEKNEGRIPSHLCTSLREHSPEDSAPSSHGQGQEASSAEATVRKRRQCRRKLKWKEVSDSELDGCEETKMTSLLLCNDSVYFSFDVPEEEAGSLQSPEMHPYSDGELASVNSPTLSHPSSLKSDSELEIRPQESFALGAESHMQWIWGRLPQTIATAATTVSAALVPVGEGTHLAVTSEGLGGGPSPTQGTPCYSALSVVEPTPAPQDENGLPELKDITSAEGKETFLETSSAAQENHEGGGSVVPDIQPDVEPFEGAAALRQVGSESPEPQLKSQRSQGEWVTGSIKRSSHLGPSDVYLEDLSNLDEEQVALCFPSWPGSDLLEQFLTPKDGRVPSLAGSDAEQSSKPVADPSNPLCVQLPSDLPTDNPTDSNSDLIPTTGLLLCGGLGSSRQISRGRWEGRGICCPEICYVRQWYDTASVPPEEFMEHMVSYQQFAENPGLINDPNLVILINKKYYKWAVAAPMVLSMQAFQRNTPESTIDQLVKEKMPKKGSRWWFSWSGREFTVEEVRLQQWLDDEPLHPGDVLAMDAPAQKPLQAYKKSLRLSSEQIGRLNLQDGPSEVAFSVTTQYRGTCHCKATIYLWNWDDEVVISDIDGTVTKSDALGHILPHLGKDWTHHRIAKLFHKICLSGYKFLYCSARAIGMAHITKSYLKWVNEQGCALPRGPILLSPSSLFSAFHRYCALLLPSPAPLKPEVFKITCLMDIQNLFATKQPFYAAFGNRANGVYAYKEVGVPESRLFTVNPKGELIQELMKNHKST